MSNDPARDALRAAFQALLNGNTAERDKQCARAERILKANEMPPPIKLVKQPDGSYRPAIDKN